jgi:peroxiredoxin
MMTSRRRKNQPHRSRRRRSIWPWIGVIVPVAIVLVLAIVGSGGDSEAEVTADAPAAMFELPTTAGTTVALQDVLAESDVLLYFSMGVGCDGCFAQIPEVSQALADRQIALLPVMVQDAELVRTTALAWGIDQPILIDADRSVSEAYGMLGINGHSDRPSHSIALVKQDGTVAFVKHYDTMFVELDDMLADLA